MTNVSSEISNILDNLEKNLRENEDLTSRGIITTDNEKI